MAITPSYLAGTSVQGDSTGACSFLNPLANARTIALAAVNRKINALRRLAGILEELGNINPFPALDIGQLVPIGRLDVSAYNNIQRNCPFLNLPPTPEGDASEVLNEFRAKLVTAYQNLVAQMMNHPWFRLGELFKQLDRFQDQVNLAGALGGDYIACLTAICEAGASAANSLDYYQQQAQQYANNFTSDGWPSVLTQGGRTKYETMREQVRQVQILMATEGEIVPVDLERTPSSILPPLPATTP